MLSIFSHMDAIKLAESIYDRSASVIYESDIFLAMQFVKNNEDCFKGIIDFFLLYLFSRIADPDTSSDIFNKYMSYTQHKRTKKGIKLYMKVANGVANSFKSKYIRIYDGIWIKIVYN